MTSLQIIDLEYDQKNTCAFLDNFIVNSWLLYKRDCAEHELKNIETSLIAKVLCRRNKSVPGKRGRQSLDRIQRRFETQKKRKSGEAVLVIFLYIQNIGKDANEMPKIWLQRFLWIVEFYVTKNVSWKITDVFPYMRDTSKAKTKWNYYKSFQ